MIIGEFATRREAELAVEHLVQEHGVGLYLAGCDDGWGAPFVLSALLAS